MRPVKRLLTLQADRTSRFHDDSYAQVWETKLDEVLYGTSTQSQLEDATITEIKDELEITMESETVRTTATETLEEDK